jgi:hypothetical protein
MTNTLHQIHTANEGILPIVSPADERHELDAMTEGTFDIGSVPLILQRSHIDRLLSDHGTCWQELVNDWGFDPDKKQTFRAVEFFAWLGY